MPFTVTLEPTALQDIQQAIDYYDKQHVGLGKKFETALNKHLISLEKNPFFQIRYDNVHCLPVKKYPYMIHFTIDELNDVIIIRSVFHTSKSPKTWRRK